jgi:hypothetical protein
MALQESVSVRNARLDAIETTISTAAILRMFTGSAPANCAAADSGTKCVEMTLPSDWLANASSGAKAKSGTWSQSSATASGTVGYWRIYETTGTTCHLQGTLTATGGGGDMTLDSLAVVAGQTVTVTAFTLTAGNS